MSTVVEVNELVKAKTVIGESILAMIIVLCTILGGTYMLVVPGIRSDIEAMEAKQLDHDVSIKALEISDARTGVHLVNLTDSINRLIVQLDR